MRLEQIPLILGLVVALVGVGLLADAWLADTTLVPRVRRRRVRAERDRRGEAIVGAGTLCLAAALMGGDSWRFGNVAVLLGAVLVLVGAYLNRHYLREVLTFRGPARRAERAERTEPTARVDAAAAGQAAPPPVVEGKGGVQGR